jgi:hypothetical protein
VRGGSTITQQAAKNLFLWPGRSMVRKALELPLALWMDLVLPKWRVLEIYLNIAEWGPNGQFGAEAASRYAFNKSVRALTAREAALLASVLPNPRRRSNSQGLRCAGSLQSTRRPAPERARPVQPSAEANTSVVHVPHKPGLPTFPFSSHAGWNMAVPKRKTSPSPARMHRSAFALTNRPMWKRGSEAAPYIMSISGRHARGRQILKSKK